MAALGDFNGDGYGDFIVGANVSGSSVVDSAYVIYGNASGTVQNLSGNTIAASAGFRIVTGVGNDSSGVSVASAGDINGDGLADAVMTVQRDNSNPSSTNNSAYVIYGKSNASSVYGSSLNVSGIASSLGFQIKGNADLFGGAASNAGDVNGDGLNDLLVTGDNNAFVIYGSASGGTIDLVGNNIASSQGYKISATNALSLGASASGVGDFNGDGLADVIVSATFRAYVVYGKSSASSVLIDGANSIVSSNGFRIYGATSFGRAVSSAGDVNGDGLADVMVSSRSEGAGGTVYVLYGNTSATGLDLDVSGGTIAAGRGFKITSAFTTDNLGSNYTSISSAGDVNGDGLADMIISGEDSTTASDRSTYIVYGNASGANIAIDASGNIASSLGFKIKGSVGYSVANGGDINGDGLTDLLVSATEVSSTYSYNVILGGTQWMTSAVNLNGTAAAEAILGTTSDDTLTGGGGIDRFFAGKGNDTIVLTASDMTNLASNATGQTAIANISGGTGFDTIRLSGGAALNLTSISNAGAMGLEENSRIESIERIDLATDTGANTLTLNANDVKDMAGFNTIYTGSASADGKTWTNVTGTALSATTKYHQLVVDGTAVDSLILSAANGFWVNVGTVNNGTSTYTAYQNVGTNSQIFVGGGVVVTNNDAVSPVILDLNLDNNFTYSQVTMDVNSDGQLDKTAWVGSQEGVLIWDKFADGTVHDSSQYAFTQYGGNTDLEALALKFDTNKDAVFDANDEKFSEFAVWQDLNQDGISDAGEVHSLSDWGITSINLTSDGVLRTSSEGVIEAGRSSATLANGSTMLVADAAFIYTDAQSSTKLTGALTMDLANLQKPVNETLSDGTKNPTETGSDTQSSEDLASNTSDTGDNTQQAGETASNPSETESDTQSSEDSTSSTAPASDSSASSSVDTTAPADSTSSTTPASDSSATSSAATTAPADSTSSTAPNSYPAIQNSASTSTIEESGANTQPNSNPAIQNSAPTSSPAETGANSQSSDISGVIPSTDTQNASEDVPSSSTNEESTVQESANDATTSSDIFVINPVAPVLDLTNVTSPSPQATPESVITLADVLQPVATPETPLIVDGQPLETPVAPVDSPMPYAGLMSGLLPEELANNTTL
jgi:hypothetical protein